MKNLEEIKPVEYYLELNYPITIYRAEEGGFVAEIEDLPGCLTEGETLEETSQRIEDARKDWIQAAYEDGVEIPLPRTDEEHSGKFMVRIPKYLHRRLAEKARREGVSLNQYVESILSAGTATRRVLDEIKTELDKISKQIDIRRAPTIHLPISEPYVVVEAIEQESPIQRFSKIKTEEMVAA